jgi:hypothetical protein
MLFLKSYSIFFFYFDYSFYNLHTFIQTKKNDKLLNQ